MSDQSVLVVTFEKGAVASVEFTNDDISHINPGALTRMMATINRAYRRLRADVRAEAHRKKVKQDKKLEAQRKHEAEVEIRLVEELNVRRAAIYKELDKKITHERVEAERQAQEILQKAEDKKARDQVIHLLMNSATEKVSEEELLAMSEDDAVEFVDKFLAELDGEEK